MTREGEIAFGQHSRIPACCIEFYITEWDNERSADSAYMEAVHLSDYEYVPCPPCFATGTKVRIKICAEECGRECWRDY